MNLWMHLSTIRFFLLYRSMRFISTFTIKTTDFSFCCNYHLSTGKANEFQEEEKCALTGTAGKTVKQSNLLELSVSVYAAFYLLGQGLIIMREVMLKNYSSQHISWLRVIPHKVLKLLLCLKTTHWNRNKYTHTQTKNIRLIVFWYSSHAHRCFHACLAPWPCGLPFTPTGRKLLKMRTAYQILSQILLIEPISPPSVHWNMLLFLDTDDRSL